MTTNKTAPVRLQSLEGQESTPVMKEDTMIVPTATVPSNVDYTPLTGPNVLEPRFASGWSAPAPTWALCALVGDPTHSVGIERDVVFASEAPAPWHAHVERFDYRDGDSDIEVGRPTIRVFGPPEAGDGFEDITTPQQAREMAASLIRAATLLERLQAPVQPLPDVSDLEEPEDEPSTPCPTWCTSQSHNLDLTPDGRDQHQHTGDVVRCGAGPTAWVQRTDTRDANGSITIGKITVGADLECGPTLEPETAGAVGVLLFSVAMQVKRLRAGEAADVA
ncbi:hypothetical protein [Clavibacter zhangzhiyongii]|uniref:hypothetical protein n=1 Tax=Clavibacter zhangzhiyongii TaxID=2768071 RepID=UPI0039DFB378